MSKLKNSILNQLFGGWLTYDKAVQRMINHKIGWRDLLEYWEEDESWHNSFESIDHFDKIFWGELAEKLEESKHE